MKSKKPNYRLPFSLPATAYYNLEIEPEVVAIALEQEGAEMTAMEAIVADWTVRADKAVAAGRPEPVFGLAIPRRFGLTGLEAEALDSTAALDRETIAKGYKLSARIAEETGRSVTEVQSAFAEGGSTDWLEPYIGDILDLEQSNSRANYTTRLYTIYIQRAIRDWTERDTITLHSAILSKLAEFADLESEGLPEKKSPQSENSGE